jgi:hypothetical protein
VFLRDFIAISMPTPVYFYQLIVCVGLIGMKARMRCERGGEEFARNDKKSILDS